MCSDVAVESDHTRTENRVLKIDEKNAKKKLLTRPLTCNRGLSTVSSFRFSRLNEYD